MASYWERTARTRIGRRRLLKSGASLSLGVSALALAGCGSDEDEPPASTPTTAAGGGGSPSAAASPTAPAADQPQRGGVYGSYFGSVGNYNPFAWYNDGYDNAGVTAYDRLITATLDSRGYVLQAAESVEIAEPTRIVFTLKPGQVYADRDPVNGRPVVASDIVAVQEYVKGLTNAENSGFQRNYMESVEAPDDQTVVFHLKEPYAYAFAATMLCNPTGQLIVPQELLDVLDTHEPVGSGPFQLESHTFNAEYQWRRNETYREAKDGKPYLDGQAIFALSDHVALETAFRGEQIHQWQPAAGSVQRILDELDESKFGSLTFLSVGLLGINAMMNAERGGPRPWHDVRVREAIYRLTDSQQIIELAMDGKAVKPAGPMHASLEAYQLEPGQTEEYFRTDVAEAKKLLEAANYDTSAVWESISLNTSPLNITMAEVWQQQLARGGFQIGPINIPLAEALPNYMQIANFDFWCSGQPGGDTPYRAMRNHHSDTGDQFNNVGLYDPDIDAMIEASERETDRETQIQLVKDLQLEVLKRYSLSYVWATQQTFLFYNNKVQNIDPDPLNGQTYRTEFWFKT